MDAVKCLEETQRMCKGRGCMNCPLENADCENFMSIKPVEFVAIVEKWSKEHPVKSYLDVYKEAMKEKFGSEIKDGASITRSICRDRAIYGCFCRHEQPASLTDCIDCWYSECKLPIKGE